MADNKKIVKFDGEDNSDNFSDNNYPKNNNNVIVSNQDDDAIDNPPAAQQQYPQDNYANNQQDSQDGYANDQQYPQDNYADQQYAQPNYTSGNSLDAEVDAMFKQDIQAMQQNDNGGYGNQNYYAEDDSSISTTNKRVAELIALKKQELVEIKKVYDDICAEINNITEETIAAAEHKRASELKLAKDELEQGLLYIEQKYS